MDEWQPWEDCIRDCSKGIQIRKRNIKVNPQCHGASCKSSIVSFTHYNFTIPHQLCQKIATYKTSMCKSVNSTDGYLSVCLFFPVYFVFDLTLV